MVAFILPARTLDSGFNISNSLRFNSGDSARLEKTFGTNTSERKKTFSLWFKRSKLGVYQSLFDTTVTGNVEGGVEITNEDRIQVTDRDATDGTGDIFLPTSMVFRDPSAWYHLVVAMDTTQGTETNRVKVYVNGSQVTSFTTTTYPTQNYDIQSFKSSVANYIGANVSSSYYNGYISEFYFIDGQQLAPTDFGKTNDNGVWIPKEYEGTYGNSGFFQQYKETGTSQNSSGIGADTSGNDNHFAVTNLVALDITTDTPTNNFATLNPLAFGDNVGTLSEGNLKHTHNSGDSDVVSTIGISSGKFYAEFKAETVASNRPAIAVYNNYDNGATNYGSVNGSVLFLQDGRILVNNSSIGDFGIISQNDIIQVAVDNDNGAIYIGQNGSYLNSGDPTSGSSRTGSVSNFTAGSVTCFIGTRANSNSFASANFGNPAFAISSGNSDGAGFGNFEFAVPSGYFALCTKNLAEYG